MRILLTGSNGQLGWELQRALAPLGELAAFDHSVFDLTRPSEFVPILRQFKPDIIVNAAAYTAVDKAESEPELAHAVNALAPGILGEEARRLGALLIHFSTDYVFDGSLTRPYTEGDLPNPQSVYGRAKLEGECAIQATACRHLIFRIAWVYGEHGANFLKTILKLARSQPSINVVNDQWGTPTSARSLAAVMRSLLQKSPPADLGHSDSEGVYHLSPAGSTTWFEFALAIATRFQLQARIYPTTSENSPRAAKRPFNSLLDSTRFRNCHGLGLDHWRTEFDDACANFSGLTCPP